MTHSLSPIDLHPSDFHHWHRRPSCSEAEDRTPRARSARRKSCGTQICTQGPIYIPMPSCKSSIGLSWVEGNKCGLQNDNVNCRLTVRKYPSAQRTLEHISHGDGWTTCNGDQRRAYDPGSQIELDIQSSQRKAPTEGGRPNATCNCKKNFEWDDFHYLFNREIEFTYSRNLSLGIVPIKTPPFLSHLETLSSITVTFCMLSNANCAQNCIDTTSNSGFNTLGSSAWESVCE